MVAIRRDTPPVMDEEAAHSAAGRTRQFVTFRLNRSLFGVDVLRVQEVLRHQPVTQVPLADAVVHGLINLRGQIVLGLNLRRRLGIAADGAAEEPMNLVVQTADGPVAMIVDEIGDVIEVDGARFEPPPEMVQGVQRELLDGVFKLDQQLLLALNVDRVVRVIN